MTDLRTGDFIEQVLNKDAMRRSQSRFAAGAVEIEKMLNERGEIYGQFRSQAALSQTLKLVMYDTEGWAKLSHDQREALDMIMHKIARVLNGDPDYPDSWVDMAGYATLVADRLKGFAR